MRLTHLVEAGSKPIKGGLGGVEDVEGLGDGGDPIQSSSVSDGRNTDHS